MQLPYTNLFELLKCHSTPGDENEVRDFLTSNWKTAGLEVVAHGQYAISARLHNTTSTVPRILICAHMDSPGFIVQEIKNKNLKLIKLGGPYFSGNRASCVLKTREGKFPIMLGKRQDKNLKDHFFSDTVPGVDWGDRASFVANPEIDSNNLILSPFLDNRIGCYIISELARQKEFMKTPGVEIILAATGCEEVGCIGVPVLARAIQPDFVICLDATYESPSQDVLLGLGPVITLSDASLILSCKMRDQMKELFQNAKIPFQTEVYNYSGTDAKGFPQIGLKCPVVSLLVATKGNHSPKEIASLKDIDLLKEAVIAMATTLDFDLFS